ncbi:MAG TPA: haloacid dehalogenase-like hydrolase [Gaiella sp.]|nr:haloacid dehalogenase-like hydrolase [Gaiella sp.]
MSDLKSDTRRASVALVLDWDGTVTEIDTLHMVNDRFGDPELFGALDDQLGRRLTLQEVIAQEIATVTAPLDEVVTYLLEHVRVRAGFRELVETYDPLIVSAGFHELIDPILVREAVEARVEANNVTADPDGWRATFRERPLCDVCGERCKRGAVAGLGPFVYVGDGISDRCVSLAAERRFARRSLAVWLDEQGVAYEPFGDLRDVASALAAVALRKKAPATVEGDDRRRRPTA